mgnify:CR=1 FL=1
MLKKQEYLERLSAYGAGGHSYSTNLAPHEDMREAQKDDGDMDALLGLLKELEVICPSKKVYCMYLLSVYALWHWYIACIC